MNSTQFILERPPISGIDTNSFASFTIKNRLPFIVDQIIANNGFAAEVNSSLLDLKANILDGEVGHFVHSGNDQSDWNAQIKAYLGKSWFEVPFYFAEAYFYRIILDRINFFEDQIDPFKSQKISDLEKNSDFLVKSFMRFRKGLQNVSAQQDIMERLLYYSLWGNKSDLSQIKLDRKQSDISEDEFTLIDDVKNVAAKIINGSDRIDIVLDNSGLELFTDLVLAEQLVSQKLSKVVVLHAKAYPTFVSDATSIDIDFLINFLSRHRQSQVIEFAKNLRSLISANKIIIRDHVFWNSAKYFYELPAALIEELSKSDLLVFKGDANYRRLYGDRKIKAGSKKIFTDYLSSSALAIRILKSELLIGMSSAKIKELNQKEPEWLINGKYGIVQLVN